MSRVDSPTAPSVEFRLLGPFEVVDETGRERSLGRAEQSLLALLLLNSGSALPSGRIAQLLWGPGAEPVDPANAVQNRVSKLRRALAALGPDHPRLVTKPGAYRLDVDRASVDAHRFVDLVVRARRVVSESPDEAEHLLDMALGLWRGAALEGLESEPWTLPEIHRLEEVRLAAAEERLSLVINSGRARDAVDSARQLVDAHPTHEGLTQQLMRALYLSGRQADALDAYRRLREMLAEELGLEPSAHLRTLESQILRQDPELGEPKGAYTQMPVGQHPTTQGPGAGAPEVRPQASRQPRGTPLPNRLNSFVGRAQELDRLAALNRDHRLLTLVGPGGAGKTSLAIEVGRLVADRYAAGVRFVSLGHITGEAYLPQVFADAVGVPAEAATESQSSLECLLDYIEDKQMLLVVDNCEHVVEPCAAIVEQLLQRSGTARVVTTSREPLAVAGEVQFRVQPLALPPLETDGEDLRGYAAVQLFIDRMHAADPSAAPTDPEQRLIADICRALDGIPLAIELAAARTATMSIAEISERLVDRFDLLTHGPRTAEERQRTLRATVDWSHAMLTAQERVLLRRLSVFRGGWTLPAAELVASGPGLGRTDVLDGLGQLVQRSLVVPSTGEHRRFSLLETVRAYAAEKLAEAGETDALAERHARWVGALADESERKLRGPEQHRWLQSMAQETDNIREALRWASGPAADPDLALQMGGALGWFFHLGRPVEGRETIRRIVALPGGGDHPRARALQAQSVLERPRACLVHPSKVCAAAAEASLGLFESTGDLYRAALSRCLLAVEGVAKLPIAQALELLETATEEFTARGDDWGRALVAFVRLMIEIKHGQPEGARHYGHLAADLFDELDDGWGLSAALFHLGIGLRQFGLHDEAIPVFERAVAVAEPLGLYNTVQWSLSGAGIAAVGKDDLDLAAAYFARAQQTRSEVGDGAGAVHAALGTALIARARGDFVRAHDRYRVAAHGYRRLGTPIPLASAMTGAARCLLVDGRMEEAESALAEVVGIGERTADPVVSAWAKEGRAHQEALRGRHAEALNALQEADAIRRAASVERLAFERREVDALRRLLLDEAGEAGEAHPA